MDQDSQKIAYSPMRGQDRNGYDSINHLNKIDNSDMMSFWDKKSNSPPKEEQIGCNCKNSKCLKLYCHCFRVGQYCTDRCLCLGCKNRLEFETERQKAVEAIKSRNPLAFKPRIDMADNVVG